MTDRERIGIRIAEIRKQKGLSAHELAELTDLKRPNISRIESGKYSTGIDILSKIANALGKKIDLTDI